MSKDLRSTLSVWTLMVALVATGATAVNAETRVVFVEGTVSPAVQEDNVLVDGFQLRTAADSVVVLLEVWNVGEFSKCQDWTIIGSEQTYTVRSSAGRDCRETNNADQALQKALTRQGGTSRVVFKVVAQAALEKGDQMADESDVFAYKLRERLGTDRPRRPRPERAARANLVLFWSDDRTDNFTAATPVGEQSAIKGKYKAVRIEGVIFKAQLPGTIPLELYWSADRTDNFSTATTGGKTSALAAGYRLVRVQGYVYPKKVPGSVPLKSYWSPGRNDNFTTATPEGEHSAKAAGYRFVRVEGYVLPASAASTAGEDSTHSLQIEEMEGERRRLEEGLREFGGEPPLL